ncbi:F-box domain [Trichoderma cornu-damae]|uniref:F-box domain n=1 Tax=Trichoderma cornu-damae TaxID=654480 RepID=A0A9P8QFD4_9HYPO|nr:F-box domain [Trichoderma cornu-damae]
MDLPSMTAFRRVQYQVVFKHYPNILGANVSIDAEYFDCVILLEILSTTKCATCDRFGCYLYLTTCKRVGSFCLTINVLYYFPV